jgi:hypothetical protein
MSKEFVKYLYFNLSGVYNGKKPLVDLTDIPGTNCYCDDAAKEEIIKKIDSWDRLDYSGNDIENCENVDGTVEDDSKFNDNSHVNGLKRIPTVRFIDSGNYHYMSLFFMRKINVPFTLLLLDNHPDTKPAVFGGITSCGGWVREASESFQNLERIIMAGVDETLLEEESPLPEKAINASLSELPSLLKNINTPLYISLDKDIMSEEYARTDWSQGPYSLDEIIGVLKDAFVTNKIIGFDICGEKKENPTSEDLQINESTNYRLLNF